MNGCNLKYVIKKPLIKPTAIPMNNTKNIHRYGLNVVSRIKTAKDIQVSATTAPTDRSIPPKPEIMVKVIPTVIMIKGALSINRFKNTCGEKKPSKAIEPMPKRITNSTPVT